MSDATKYNPIVAWYTLAGSVYQLTRENLNTPATYRISTKVIDSNNSGAGQKQAGYVFTDNIGTPYRITAVGTSFIDVSDDFRRGCPVSGKIGIVHKSAYKGQSLYLPSEMFLKLHPSAASNNNKYAMAILWNNDPNPRQISFTNSNEPKITGYQGVQLDGSKLYEDYGENPKIRLIQIDEFGNRIDRTEKPYYQLVGGLIDIITFGVLPDPITGYIEISR